MPSGPAGFRHGVPERLVPDGGQRGLSEAEFVARYLWAAQLATGRRVLDAGCGAGYGCALLAAVGAEVVVGVSDAGEVLDSARSRMSTGVRLDVAELHRLPYPDGDFDLIVCFDVLETLEEPGPVLDELVRVLAPGGIFLVSWPNRAGPAQPSSYHRPTYAPKGLGHELRLRLDHVALLRQDVYLTVALLADEEFLAGDRDVREIALHKMAAGERGAEEFTVAMASRNPLPRTRPLAVMADSLQVQSWYAAFAEHHAILAADRARIMELEEQLTATLARAERAEGVVASVVSSASWRLTSPLRLVKNSFRSRQPR